MSNSKLVTSGLFAFTSAFLVYLILKKNKKTLNLLLKDNLTEKQIDNIFNEEYNKDINETDNENNEQTKKEIIEDDNDKKENNLEINKKNNLEINEENNLEINEEENDSDEMFNFQKVSNLEKKIKFILDDSQKQEKSWFSFFQFK